MRLWKRRMLSALAMGLLFVSLTGTANYLFTREPRFEPAEEQQRAVFHIERGAAGVQGNAVYLDSPPHGRPLAYNGIPIYIVPETLRVIERYPNPAVWLFGGNDVLRIVAVIHLERSKVTVTTKDLRQMEVYSVVIDKLIHVERSPRRTN